MLYNGTAGAIATGALAGTASGLKCYFMLLMAFVAISAVFAVKRVLPKINKSSRSAHASGCRLHSSLLCVVRPWPLSGSRSDQKEPIHLRRCRKRSIP